MMKFFLILLFMFMFNKKYLSIIKIMLMIFLLMYMNLYQSMNSFTLINKMFMMDQMSITLMMLTMWISFLMILASNKIFINHNYKTNFTMLIMMLNFILLLSFTMQNFMNFYIMFETSLIPTLLLILGWGYQPERLQASMYLLLYTITASLPLLLSLMWMYNQNGHLFMFMNYFNSMNYMNYPLNMLWWMMSILAFMVKMPIYLMHLWLPKAHVEAPIAGSMILAGLLLKLGGYAFMRMTYIYPYLTFNISPFLTSLALWGGVITSLICIRQTDIKSLIAYSSISHMALMCMGVSFLSTWGWYGALMIMIAHGLSSSCLFMLANLTYENTSTRSMYLTKGMITMFPTMSMWWFITSLTNMAGPPSLNLLSEINLIMSNMWISLTIMIPLMIMIFMTATYSLILYTSMNHGSISNYSNPLILLSPNFHSMNLFHLLPIFMLIFKPELLSMSF
uniref:NADH-ubiquinone oxidoreductase chain 4 n=1 Tax=Gesiella jameensis TaxID=1960709 RepID=A0A8E7MIN8_9ANNE|nr:NADH dehydrogenase subunit 4 [Gesiella jameensis]